MAKKQFKAESKRLLELMIHSIYTHKEIFLRELLSNASDAIDKVYYKALTQEGQSFNRDDYYIRITPNEKDRTLTIEDTGIGMNREELEKNLGTIASSGSLAFKEANAPQEGVDLIGQFGVGFYSAFMVAEKVEVLTRPHGAEEAWLWSSTGTDGYTVKEASKESHGTIITLTLKENDPENDEEDYTSYLRPFTLKNLVKKYSDFIRYPIRMEVPVWKAGEGDEDPGKEVPEDQVLNSMVPLWRKNRQELKEEDYLNFYQEKRYGFDTPLRHVHASVEGAIRYNALLYIPGHIPYQYYTKEFEKGLELYANGILIMEKCPDLLPDYFSFVKGLVDSEDLSLNISREMLQQDRQLKLIAKNLQKKIHSELLSMLEQDRENYETFFKAFGRQLKYGVYADYGMNREVLEDLLLFHDSGEGKLLTLKEYREKMPEGQKYIYYATGESPEKLDRIPQTERVKEAGFSILYLTEDVDEFALKVLGSYQEKEYRSVSSADLGLEPSLLEEGEPPLEEGDKELFAKMKELLGNRVQEVKASRRLKSHPVCLTNQGDISIEMEKVLSQMPESGGLKAEKVLELNLGHPAYQALKKAFQDSPEDFALYTNLLYGQALLIEGLPLEDPLEFANNMTKLFH